MEDWSWKGKTEGGIRNLQKRWKFVDRNTKRSTNSPFSPLEDAENVQLKVQEPAVKACSGKMAKTPVNKFTESPKTPKQAGILEESTTKHLF